MARYPYDEKAYVPSDMGVMVGFLPNANTGKATAKPVHWACCVCPDYEIGALCEESINIDSVTCLTCLGYIETATTRANPLPGPARVTYRGIDLSEARAVKIEDLRAPSKSPLRRRLAAYRRKCARLEVANLELQNQLRQASTDMTVEKLSPRPGDTLLVTHAQPERKNAHELVRAIVKRYPGTFAVAAPIGSGLEVLDVRGMEEAGWVRKGDAEEEARVAFVSQANLLHGFKGATDALKAHFRGRLKDIILKVHAHRVKELVAMVADFDQKLSAEIMAVRLPAQIWTYNPGIPSEKEDMLKAAQEQREAVSILVPRWDNPPGDIRKNLEECSERVIAQTAGDMAKMHAAVDAGIEKAILGETHCPNCFARDGEAHTPRCLQFKIELRAAWEELEPIDTEGDGAKALLSLKEHADNMAERHKEIFTGVAMGIQEATEPPPEPEREADGTRWQDWA